MYNVGRLTDAPGGGLFPFQGGTLWQWRFPFWGTLWRGLFLSWGTLWRGLFLSWGTLWRGQVCEGERRSELRSPLFPLALPLSGHVAVLRCGVR